MHSNTHFRVLALTATPGSKPEDVQELCDAMHVSHIEIRDEHSPDLKQYVFDKVRIPVPLPSGRVINCRASCHAGNRTTYRGNE